jgi:sugar (pentulose or hexulose) kinase
MNDSLAAGIDLGTSGVRVAVVDRSGRRVGGHAVRLAPADRRDPAALWAAVVAALQGVDLRQVGRVAVAGTSGTILPVDASGTPLGPLSLYNDGADPALAARVAAVAPAASAAVGATSPLARALAWDVTAQLLHEADWVAGRLRGAFGLTDANNALKTGYDVAAELWPDWIAAAGLARHRLPAVAAPGAVLGGVGTEAVAAGLPRRAVVVAGTTDGCASFLATGASETGDAVTALGSTLTVKLLSAAPVQSAAHGVYSHRLLGRWLAGGASNTGGAALAQFFSAGQLAALSAAIDPARDSGLDYYPLPRPGERFPVADPALPPRTDPRPADDVAFLHGLLEGIARVEAAGYARLAALGGPAVRRVLTVGGGAANPAWTALRQRILGVPVFAAAEAEAAYGAALLAATGVVGV